MSRSARAREPGAAPEPAPRLTALAAGRDSSGERRPRDRTRGYRGLLRRDRRPGGPRVSLRARGHGPGHGRRGRARAGAAGVRRGHPDRRLRAAGHARAGQHPLAPVPVDHPRLRDRRHPVRLAGDAVPDLGPADPGPDERRRRGQPGLAGPDRLHVQHGPPVRVPGRRGRPARGGDPGRPADRRALPPDPRLDEPRPVGRRPAAGLRGRGPRHDTGRLTGCDRPLARPGPGLHDPHRASRPARRSR